MNYRIGLVPMALVTVVLISSGCALFGEQRAAGKPAAMLLVTTARSSGSEVSLSRIALARSSNPAVKRFAQQTIADHEKMNQEIKHLSNRRGIPFLPVPDEMNQQVCAHLLKLSGEELDREYIREIVAEHAKMAVKFDPEGQQEKDPEIRQWAARQLPIFQEHLQMAQSIHQNLIAAHSAFTAAIPSSR
jgi:putative membrane protein